MTIDIDIAELFARRERERDAPARQRPTSHSGPSILTLNDPASLGVAIA